MTAWQPDPEKHAEDRIDQGVLTAGQAHGEVGRVAVGSAARVTQSHEAPSRSRPSRRGGRSYNEGSDSEHDPYSQGGSYVELTDEQRATRDRGIARVRAAIDAAQRREKETPDRLAIDIESRHAAVNASWDAVEAQIGSKEPSAH